MQDAGRSTDIFFIIEQLYPRDSLLPSIGELGPSLMQVYRTVYELIVKQDIYLDGHKIKPGNTTLWQSIKYMTGGKVTINDAPGHDCLYNLVYSGSTMVAVPLDGFESNRLNLLSKKLVFTPPIFNYGSDPVKRINLYARGGLSFFMEEGGQGTPIAAAKYNRKTGELMVIRSRRELSQLMAIVAHKCKKR